MTDDLFSLRNELSRGPDDPTYIELNPAVVSRGAERMYAFSAVCIGPEIEAETDGISLEVSCDGQRSVLPAVHQQAEATEADEWLTVALFSVSRALLETVASAGAVEVGLQSGGGRLRRHLDAQNRHNVGRFLDLVCRHPTQALPGRAAVAAGAIA